MQVGNANTSTGITVGCQPIEEVKQFTYLGSVLSNDGNTEMSTILAARYYQGKPQATVPKEKRKGRKQRKYIRVEPVLHQNVLETGQNKSVKQIASQNFGNWFIVKWNEFSGYPSSSVEHYFKHIRCQYSPVCLFLFLLALVLFGEGIGAMLVVLIGIAKTTIIATTTVTTTTATTTTTTISTTSTSTTTTTTSTSTTSTSTTTTATTTTSTTTTTSKAIFAFLFAYVHEYSYKWIRKRSFSDRSEIYL
ncbi:unnamed protein product [Rotaria sp. Silwood2]|nr:unnamed protein product [Rotaria sp. Silwood2]